MKHGANCYDPEIHTVRCGKIHGLKLAAIKISSQRVTHCFFDLICKNVEWKVLCGPTLNCNITETNLGSTRISRLIDQGDRRIR
jgi:hypothetical protein